MKILLITPNSGAVTYHRLISPHIVLKDNYDVKVYHTQQEAHIINPAFKDVDVIVFSRLIQLSHFEVKGNKIPIQAVIEGLKKEGKKIIVDVDDYWKVDDHHIAAEHFNSELHQEVVKSTFQMASDIICTHKRLKKLIRPYNKRITVIPNTINRKESQWKPNPKRTHTFGYIGGNTHQEDLRSIQTNFKDVNSIAYVKDYDWCFKDIGEIKNEFEYGNLLDNFYCSLAPLKPSKFTKNKSNLKVLEAAAKGCAVAVTKTPPYTDWLPDSVITFDPDESWERLKSYTKKELIERGEALHQEHLKEYDPNEAARVRFELYKK